MHNKAAYSYAPFEWLLQNHLFNTSMFLQYLFNVMNNIINTMIAKGSVYKASGKVLLAGGYGVL